MTDPNNPQGTPALIHIYYMLMITFNLQVVRHDILPSQRSNFFLSYFQYEGFSIYWIK
jgi:hypothetical protein